MQDLLFWYIVAQLCFLGGYFMYKCGYVERDDEFHLASLYQQGLKLSDKWLTKGLLLELILELRQLYHDTTGLMKSYGLDKTTRRKIADYVAKYSIIAGNYLTFLESWEQNPATFQLLEESLLQDAEKLVRRIKVTKNWQKWLMEWSHNRYGLNDKTDNELDAFFEVRRSLDIV
jgi:hypothetical protein